MTELPATPIPDAEAKVAMADDIAALVKENVECPLAKAIDEALAALNRATDACKRGD